MRLKINLAQKPFYNRKLFWLSFLGVSLLLLASGKWTLEKIEQAKDVTRRLEETIKKQELDIKALKAQVPPPPPELTPKQIEEIQASAELIKQRRFSWTRLMEEFEQALPKEVKIVSISPSKDLESTEIPITIKVYAKSVTDLTKMIATMDKEGIFSVTPTSQETPAQSGDIGFSLKVDYKPRPSNKKLVKKPAQTKQVVDNGDDDE